MHKAQGCTTQILRFVLLLRLGVLSAWAFRVRGIQLSRGCLHITSFQARSPKQVLPDRTVIEHNSFSPSRVEGFFFGGGCTP